MLRKSFSLLTSYRHLAEKFWSPFAEGKTRGADVSCYKAKENLLSLIGSGKSRRLLSMTTPNPHTAEEGLSGQGAASASEKEMGAGSAAHTSSATAAASSTNDAKIKRGSLAALLASDGITQELRREVALNEFMCQVNGIVGSVDTIENMFITILTGFDIVKVVMDAAPDDAPSRRGTIYVHHSRPFLGWQPTNTVIFFPFYMFLEKGEGETNSLSHLVLRFEFEEALRSAGCPEEVMQVLGNREALRMLAALRRVRVKPEAISWEALAKAAADKQTFDKAQGPYN